MNTSRYDHLFKIIVVGNWGVGKTSLQTKYLYDVFNVYATNMAAIDFGIKLIQLDAKLIKLQIWDTCRSGRQMHINYATPFYRGTHGVLLVYDVTNQRSFEDLSVWLDIIANDKQKDIVKVMVGNKCDLTSQRVVEYDTAKDFADQHGLTLMETSACDGTNVEQAFVRLAAEIKRKVDLSPPSEDSCKEKQRPKTNDYKCCIS